MRKLLLVSFLMCFSYLSFATNAEQTKAERYKYFKELQNDDDWLTGVWIYESDSAMSLFSLFEKSNEGYTVKNYYPRYTITWWTGKVDKRKDKILTWNYEIIDGKLQIPKKPSDIEIYKNSKLTSSKDTYYKVRYPVMDDAELKWLSGVEFTTGQGFIEAELEKTLTLKNSMPHYQVLIASKKLKSGGDLKSFHIENLNVLDKDKYYLAGVTTGWPPRSGHCGASENTGYYWVHLTSNSGKWVIKDEWIKTKNVCFDNQSLEFEKPDSDRGVIYARDPKDYKVVDCYEISLKELSKKPSICGQYTFSTKNFEIVIESNCKNGTFTCEKFTYQGTSKKSGASIKLKGGKIKTKCNNKSCPSIGYEFKNGNITYQVLKSGFLKVIQGKNKVLLNEQGEWKH